MMRNKLIYIYIILICAFSTGYAQDNHIHNSSFEDANGSPSLEGQFRPNSGTSIYPEAWEVDIHIDDAINHSPDWYDVNTSVVNYRATSSNGGAHSGNRYAGMHDYEVLEQALFNGQSLQSGKAYLFSTFFQFSEFKINYPESFPNSGSTLKVFAGKKKLEYKANSQSDKCKSDYVHFGDGPTQSIREVASFPLSTAVYPVGGGWYKLSQLFIAPSGHDYLGFPAEVYDWIGIELVNDDYEDIGQGSSCQKSYILLDDVSLTEYCSHDCAPELGTITHGTLPTAMNGALWNTTYKFTMENVMGFEFEVYSRWNAGTPVYHFRTFNSTGLKDPTFSDFLFVWNGHDDQGSGLQQGVYDLWMRMWNCDEDIVWNNYALLIDAGASSVYPHLYESSSYVLPNCICVPERYVQNTTFTDDENINSQDFIIAGENVTTGSTGPVNIQHIINFAAENYIELLPGFEAKIGVFNAEIAPCASFHRLRKLPSQSENLQVYKPEQSLNIYPNPSSEGNFTIDLPTLHENLVVDIYNDIGMKVRYYRINKNYSFKIDFSIADYAPGTYYVSVNDGEKLYHNKIIFMK